MYEILLANHLHAARRYRLAARILLPAIDTLEDDRHLVSIARDRLGQIYGYCMLSAFAGDRDYERTLEYAEVLAKRFVHTRFHGYAVELAKQLPSRKGDFKEHRLPTPEEWKKLRKDMSRERQIQFLCDRLRLLNCFQESQPGGVNFRAPQYAEPCGMIRDASWGGRGGKTYVINPLVELEARLQLTVADIPTIAPRLKERWFLPTVSFWRDFHPGRTLWTTRSVLAELINRVAGQEICKDDIDDEQIEGIVEWARKNSRD